MSNTQSTNLPPDLAAFGDSYAELFGEVPPLPKAKFEFSSEIDPSKLRLTESARAFYNKTFDTKTTQLMLFGMVLVMGVPAARDRAIAARRAGASWQELHQVTELASAAIALNPFNNGSAILNELRQQEEGRHNQEENK